MATQINSKLTAQAPLAASQAAMPDLSPESLKDRMGKIVARTIQMIAGDFKRRMEECRPDHISPLASGYWYSNDYFDALKQCNQPKRLEYFINNGSFYHGFPNTKETGMASIPGPSSTGKHPGAFILAKDCTSASKALKSFQDKLVIADCAQLCQVAQYQALLEILGEEKFDKLFSSEPMTRMMIAGYAMPGHPLFVFLKQSTAAGDKDARALEIGQRVAFANFAQYQYKHMNGEAAAFNAICVDATCNAQKFVALGTASEGFSEDEMAKLLVDEYNKDPRDFSQFTPELAQKIKSSYNPQALRFFESIKDHKITQADLTNGTGFNPEMTVDFDMKIVELALSTPIKKLSIDMLMGAKEWSASSTVHLK